MADTLQNVAWHLRHACPVRLGGAADDLSNAFEATYRLRQLNHALAEGDVYGDICVTSEVYFRGERAPFRGFRIGDAFAPVGGLAIVRQACLQCSANALSAGAMAGCCGTFYAMRPDDLEVEATLRRTIAGGLADRFAASFPSTTPLWYGLWISSPFSRAQLELLPELLRNLPDRTGDLAHFRRACGLAAEHHLELHARLSPPGHTDLGLYSIYPHCPRCKVGIGYRGGKTLAEPVVTCRVCGHRFGTPAREVRDDEDIEADMLERLLSPLTNKLLREAWLGHHAADNPAPGPEFPADDSSHGSFLTRLRSWLGL